MQIAAKPSDGKATIKNRRHKMLLKIHQIVGLKLSLFMTFVLLTGTLAVFSDELDWLLNSKLRVAAQPAPYLSLGELTDTAKASFPELRIRRAEMSKSAYHAAAFLIQDNEGEFGWLFINPYTGEVTGLSRYLNVRRFLREVHRNLMLPTIIGIPIVSSMAVLLFISLITGLLTYKKFWRKFLKWPSKRNIAAFWSSLHRLLGVWSIWFILLVVLTSFWYLFEILGGRAPQYRSVFSVTSDTATEMPYKTLQQTVVQEFPHLTITQIIPSNQPDRPALFYGQTHEILVRDRANFVAVHPQTGKIVDFAETSTLTLHQRISEMADPLHFGTFAGLTSRVIWFIFGLILTLLSVSAVRMYAIKLQGQYHADTTGWQRIKSGLGVWYWLSLGLIATAFIAWPFREY